MKLFKQTIFIFTLLTVGYTYTSYAQDTTKKAKPAAAKPATIKPAAVKSNPYATQPKYALNKPAATSPVKPTTPGTLPANTAVKPVPQLPVSDPALLNDKSLNGQYQYLLTRVYHYQQPLISALWKNFSDTLNVAKRKLNDAAAKLSVQTKRADSVQTELNNNQHTLTQSNAKVDEISLLGMPLTKATYNWIMWGLVIGFGAIAAIVIVRSGTYSREAKYRVKLYDELEEDFKNYKAKANEKEKKLARELQTERNKLDELMGRG